MKSNEYLERDYVEWRRGENQTQEGDGETSSTGLIELFLSHLFFIQQNQWIKWKEHEKEIN